MKGKYKKRSRAQQNMSSSESGQGPHLLVSVLTAVGPGANSCVSQVAAGNGETSTEKRRGKERMHCDCRHEAFSRHWNFFRY